jgi:hypothetical protein
MKGNLGEPNRSPLQLTPAQIVHHLLTTRRREYFHAPRGTDSNASANPSAILRFHSHQRFQIPDAG